MSELFDSLKLENSKENVCKGIYFRGYTNSYFIDGKIEFKSGFRFLKRMSCPGCEHCGGMFYAISESLYSNNIIIPQIEHGKLYTVAITNIHTDWETGYVEDYDIEFVLVEE